jgi:hypothetical protein
MVIKFKGIASMDDILFDIRELMNNFIQRNGKDPERLYIGEVEWRQLKKTVQPYLIKVCPKNKEPEIYNMKIYIVNTFSHLFVV